MSLTNFNISQCKRYISYIHHNSSKKLLLKTLRKSLTQIMNFGFLKSDPLIGSANPDGAGRARAHRHRLRKARGSFSASFAFRRRASNYINAGGREKNSRSLIFAHCHRENRSKPDVSSNPRAARARPELSFDFRVFRRGRSEEAMTLRKCPPCSW